MSGIYTLKSWTLNPSWEFYKSQKIPRKVLYIVLPEYKSCNLGVQSKMMNVFSACANKPSIEMNGPPCWTLGGVAAAMFTDSAVACRQISQNENVTQNDKKPAKSPYFISPLVQQRSSDATSLTDVSPPSTITQILIMSRLVLSQLGFQPS